MKIRTKLVQFGLGAMIAPILLAAVLGYFLVTRAQETFRRSALEQNRAFMISVDAEIRGHILTMQALATSKSLDTNDIQKFKDEAERVLVSQADWRNITLAAPSGLQLVNIASPNEARKAHLADTRLMDSVLRTGQPVVGNIALGRFSKKYGIPVRIPVVRNGAIAYLLTVTLRLEAFEKMIKSRSLGKAWVSGLVDGTGHFIARVPPRPPSETSTQNFLNAVTRSNEGWYHGVTLDGFESITFYEKSAFTGWSAGLAVPLAEVNAAAYNAVLLVVLGGMLAIALTMLIAYRMGVQIATPIVALATVARRIGQEGAVPAAVAINASIQEVRDVAHALTESADAVHEREQMIVREQENLRTADRAKNEFLAMLGHELRNPLSAVRNAALLLGQPLLSDENRAAAQAIINRQTEQLTRLVDDLLEVGRVVAGKIHLEKSVVDMGEVVDAAIAAIKSTGRADAHHIEAQISTKAPVLGDRSRLEQVIGNLITNAVNYTPADGSISVAVKAEAEFVLISVTDTGVGLEEKDREEIFTLFYQANKSLHRSGGLGIGLTLVKRIVEMHDGVVSVYSAGPQTGTTFTIRLPLLKATHFENTKSNQIAPAVGCLDIIVIDDSEDARESMRLLLEYEGHRVNVASDGKSGVEAILASRPAVAIVDIGMPGMDGYQLAQEVRRQYRAPIVLIAMTGYGQPDDVRRALDAGFDAHIVKPADFAVLNALLVKFSLSSAGSS